MHAPSVYPLLHTTTRNIAPKRLVVPRRDATPGNVHVKRPGEVCMFWESGIISSIKSGRVPRGCAACTCSYALFDPRLGTRTPFFLSLSLPRLFHLFLDDPLDPPHFHYMHLPRCLCAIISTSSLLCLYISYSFCLPPFLTSPIWDETEQVDNLRIMQKIILHPPSSLSTLCTFLTTSNRSCPLESFAAILLTRFLHTSFDR